MNERIRELAEQAGYTPDMFGVGHWDMPECQKFAELILGECLRICGEGTETQTTCTDSAQLIRQHFGIKTMKDDIMVNEFEYSENESLRRLIKKYTKVIDKQQKMIENLQERLESKEKVSYDREGMIANLEEAQALLSDVYHEACDAGLTEIESLMSAADSCVCEALDALQAYN